MTYYYLGTTKEQGVGCEGGRMVMYRLYFAGTDGPLLLITGCSLHLEHHLFQLFVL